MIPKIKLNWNPQRFGSSFVRRKAARMVGDFLEELNQDGKGPDRLRQLIRTNRNFGSVVKPEVLGEYIELARQYSFVTKMITDAELVSMLPEWVIVTVRSEGAPGWKWLKDQLAWLRNDVFAGP